MAHRYKKILNYYNTHNISNGCNVLTVCNHCNINLFYNVMPNFACYCDNCGLYVKTHVELQYDNIKNIVRINVLNTNVGPLYYVILKYFLIIFKNLVKIDHNAPFCKLCFKHKRLIKYVNRCIFYTKKIIFIL